MFITEIYSLEEKWCIYKDKNYFYFVKALFRTLLYFRPQGIVRRSVLVSPSLSCLHRLCPVFIDYHFSDSPVRALPNALSWFCLGSAWAPCYWFLLLVRVVVAFIERRLSLLILFIIFFCIVSLEIIFQLIIRRMLDCSDYMPNILLLKVKLCRLKILYNDIK
jgi:hypothetical protein